MKIKILIILIGVCLVAVGCNQQTQTENQNTNKNLNQPEVNQNSNSEQSLPTIITEYSNTPSYGIMGGIETRYIFYSDGSYKHYQQGKEVMNYNIVLTRDELNRLIKSPNDENVIQSIVSSVYKRELEVWKSYKENQN